MVEKQAGSAAASTWKLFQSAPRAPGASGSADGTNSYLFASKLTVGLAAAGVAAYLLVYKYNGRDYFMSLRNKNAKVTLEQRCAHIKKKIDSMWKASLKN